MEGDGKSWDTRHGWEHEEEPFSIGKHPLPQEHLVQEVGEGAPKPSTVAAPGWVLRRGCCGEESQEPWGGSAGPPQARAPSLRAEVAVVMDLPCQATLGPRRPLHGRFPATSGESWQISGSQLPLQ